MAGKDKTSIIVKGDHSHYTTMSTLDKIFETNCFQLKSIEEQNDINERMRHKENADCIFTLCFCKSNTEKIPLWYLYSGLDGKGVRISLTQSKMKTFVDSINEIECYRMMKQDGERNELERIGIPSKESYELKIGYVYYVDEKIKRIKYHNRGIEKEEMEADEDYPYLLKDYPWEYEKEFRIVIIFKDREYIRNNGINRVKISFSDDILREMKILLAPEVGDDRSYLQSSWFVKYQKLLMEKKVGKSGLKIMMDLFGKNIEGFEQVCCASCNKKGNNVN